MAMKALTKTTMIMMVMVMVMVKKTATKATNKKYYGTDTNAMELVKIWKKEKLIFTLWGRQEVEAESLCAAAAAAEEEEEDSDATVDRDGDDADFAAAAAAAASEEEEEEAEMEMEMEMMISSPWHGGDSYCSRSLCLSVHHDSQQTFFHLYTYIHTYIHGTYMYVCI